MGKPRTGRQRIGNIDPYIDGFLAGQAVAYCERVNTGGGLAAQLVCPNSYVGKLIPMIGKEGCRVKLERHGQGRTSIWIYRDKAVRRLIDLLQSSRASELGIWSMGKLFGYADQRVVGFIKRST